MAYGPEQRIELALPTPARFLTPGVVALLVLMIIGYALFSHFNDLAMWHLALNPAAVLSGGVWQLLTYPFVSGACGLVWNSVIVLFLGSAIEREWRTRSFLALWVVVGIVCGLLWIGVSFIVPLFTNALLPAGMTASGCAYGIVGAFGVLFYRRRFWFFFWTIEAQQFAWLVVAIGLVIGIAWPPMWVWVAGAGVAYLYLKLTWGARDIWAGRRAAQRSRFEGLG